MPTARALEKRTAGQNATGAWAPLVRDLIPSGGTALDRRTRQGFESAFHFDFSNVRVHSGDAANRMARSVDAEAYTMGRDIVFGTGRFRPDTATGRGLLAHELAHVAQQNHDVAGAATQTPVVSRPGDALEREAHAVADGSRSSQSVTRASGGQPMLNRVALGNNDYGKWDIVETPMSAAKAGDVYNHKIAITFVPEAKKVNSSEIAFVQSAKVVDAKKKWALPAAQIQSGRVTKEQSSVDSVTKRAWIGYDNADKPYAVTPPGEATAQKIVEPGSSPKPLKNAVTRDWPGWNVPSLSWSFITATIARRGTDAGTVYGAVRWGFEVDAANKITAFKPALDKAPGDDWKKAVEAWNTQAKGPAAKRAAADQEELPAFTFPK